MAAVVEPKDPKDTAATLGAQVDEQLAQATTRIRAHDLAFGALVLVGLVLAYATAMILLDKYLVLPQWARQLSLLGFVGALAGTAYLTIVSPLRKRINPLYAAKQVESTIDDAKNSVTGYVDAQQRGTLGATVQAALATRAAKSVAAADVNKAVDHRNLLYLGGVAIGLFLTLVVLFFVFRPAQFGSLVRRTFVPFTPTAVATRTQINLTKPDPAEPTITDGQTISVAVHIGGKVPSADGPERVRLLIRHNPADPNYIELPMPEGDTARDFELKVPHHHVQNGFWYKVAAGDAETPEYKVTVRSLPLFTRFQVAYEPPKYLRRKIEVVESPLVQGYRGTTVLLTAGTNHEVRDGLMVIEPGGAVVKSAPVTDDPRAMHFRFTLKESGRYKLTYTTTAGETSAEPFSSTITVQTDAAPTLVIDKPEDEEVVVPANGQLAIDGKVGDDFGIDTVTLKLRLTGAAARDLPDRPFLYGKSPSFKREKDGTYPTDVAYKGSVNFADLTKDAAGLPFEVKPDMVFEYWLEATDNCTEPKPNVGKSAVKRVRLGPPAAEEPQQKDLDRQKNERKNEEQKHNADQQQKLEQEKRDQPQQGEKQPQQGEKKDQNGAEGAPKKEEGAPMGGNPPPKKEDGQPNEGQPKKDGSAGETGGMGGTSDKGMNEAAPMPKDKGAKGDNPPKNGGDPQPNPMQPTDPNGGGMGSKQPETAPMPKTQDEKDVQRKADDLKNAIEQENKTGGSAKPNDAAKPEERTDPARPKPEPKGDMGGAGGMAEQKPEPKPNPMQPEKGAPAAGKPEGAPEKPAEPSAAKPEAPKQGDPMAGQKGGAPAEKRDEPLGAPPGTEKPQPEKPQPAPKGADQKQDPNSGSSAKPATEKGADQPPGGAQNPNEKRDPAADAGSKAKPMAEQGRGAEKPTDPKGKSAPPEPKGENKPEAGEAKPDKAPPAAGSKPMPKDDMMPGGAGQAEAKPEAGGANESKKPNGTGAAETKPEKPDPKNAPMGASDPGTEKGTEKPDPKNAKPQGNGAGAPKDKKLTEQEQKELEEAAKNLTSPDEKKKQDARDKLDKAIGQQKREELEKLANDLQSPDQKTREDAQRKLEDLKKQAQKGGGDKKGEAPKLDEKQKQEVADAVKDLQSGDKDKQQAARDKLDKMVGEQARKDAEQLMNDLKSDDKDTRAAAEKKLDDLRKEMDKRAAEQNPKKDGAAKGKEPSKEELEALAKKVQDLQSKDPKTREQAEKELDDKIGKENREKLQEQMKNQKPGDPAQDQKLREEMDKMAKDRANKEHDPKGGGLGTGALTKEAMEEDARNRLKTAELQLEQFEKKKYDDAFKRKQGFTDAEYEKFLRDYERYVEKLRADAAKGVASGDKPPPKGAAETGGPITAGGAGKVEGRPAASSGTAGTVTTEPPGFENLKDKFQKLLNEKK